MQSSPQGQGQDWFCQYCDEWSLWSTLTVTVAVTGSSVATVTTLPTGGRAAWRANDSPSITMEYVTCLIASKSSTSPKSKRHSVARS